MKMPVNVLHAGAYPDCQEASKESPKPLAVSHKSAWLKTNTWLV